MIELNAANFQEQVIGKSHRVPVLVDFWAEWCAPCKMLVPVLEALAADYADQLHIAKVNTDVERELAAQHGIRSLPTLQLYRNGELVEEVLGAQPESALRTLIEQYLVRASDNTLQVAQENAAAGDIAGAVTLLQQAYAEDPQNPRLPLELARLYLQAERFDEAGQLLSGLPHEIRESDTGKHLQMLLEFARGASSSVDTDSLTARLESDPADAEARFLLASRKLMAGNYDAALEGFMELLKRDRGYGDGAAQRGLLTVFSALGEDDERVGAYRRKMFNLLH
jgi:putative thioredoxin